MARARNQTEIVRSLLAFYQLAQPNLDLKPGTSERDLFVEGYAEEEAKIQSQLTKIAFSSSIKFSAAKDLENLVSNLDQFKNKGSKATGLALLTFKNLDSDLAINKGDLITAKNGSTFLVSSSLVVSSLYANKFRAIASQFKNDLDFLRITDQFAIQIPIEASVAGDQGNISKYSLSSTQIVGVSQVTNIKPFGGGSIAQDDNALKNKALAVFNGSSTGTTLGYQNTVKENTSVLDSIVITAGDPLMLRDGTQVLNTGIYLNNPKIIKDGSGGKVDIIVFGFNFQESFDSFLYQDKSNSNDPVNVANDFILGQLVGDDKKSFNRRRLDALTNQVLPTQPINNLIEVIGTSSGNNFVEKQVDSLGRVTGNYQLIKDIGVLSGSPFGFDRFHWISNIIQNLPEDKVKLSLNSQDPFNFIDVVNINKIQQNIVILNENSNVDVIDHSILKLLHFPVVNVSRIYNTITGEIYQLVDLNLDLSTGLNLTGEIKIFGKTLPAITDVLQVDYTWLLSYDGVYDFDNLSATKNNIRLVSDSIDWGFNNKIPRELLQLTITGSYYSIITSHPIAAVVSVNTFLSEIHTVILDQAQLSIIVDLSINNILSIIRKTDNLEVWKTSNDDGSINSGNKIVYFPSDALINLGDEVIIIYNLNNLYDVNNSSFNNNEISLPLTLSLPNLTTVEVNYFANLTQLLSPISLSELPLLRNFNHFDSNNFKNIGFQPTTHLYQDIKIIKNLRLAPSYLIFNLLGSFAPGILTLTGTTITKIEDLLVTITSSDGLLIDVSSALKNRLNLNSITSLPSKLFIVKVAKVEKVITDFNLNVLFSIYQYNLLGYQLQHNDFDFDNSLKNINLAVTEILLPSNQANLNNKLEIGDHVKITIEYAISQDLERMFFSRSGRQISTKKYLLLDIVNIASGFNNSSAVVSIESLNQPLAQSKYRAFYNYLAPKPNERITIRYNYDKLISDVTLAVEQSRVLEADVLVKAPQAVLVSVILDILVTEEFKNNLTTVQQNVQDVITAKINFKKLNFQLDRSDLIEVAYQIEGVDRVEPQYFNISGETGSVLSITAQRNQYLKADSIIINIKARTL